MPSPERSRIMRAVKSKNTGPEMRVRRLLHKMGYRYRLHLADLPGKPDLVFKKRRVAIFVHGCFWHGHDCKRGARVPKENASYWAGKIAKNRMRDQTNQQRLEALGFRVLTLWECGLGDEEGLAACLRGFLDDPDGVRSGSAVFLGAPPRLE